MARKNKTLQQALLEARLQYAGDLQALGQQKTQSQRDYQSELANAAGTHRGIVASINAAKPELQKGYSQSEGTRSAAYNQVIPGLSKLSSVADAIKAGIIAESGSSKALLAEGRRGAFADLTSRKTEAASGEAFARSNALHVLHTALSDIGKQRGQTLHQRSLYAHKVYSDLLAAQAAALQQQAIANARNATTLQAARIGAGARIKAARISAGSHRRGKSKFTGAQSRSAWGQIKLAQSYFGKLSKAGVPRSQIYSLLTQGYKTPTKSWIDAKGVRHSSGGTKIPQIARQYVNAGADLHYFGHLSPLNMRTLKGIGIPRGLRWNRSAAQASFRLHHPPRSAFAGQRVIGHGRF